MHGFVVSPAGDAARSVSRPWRLVTEPLGLSAILIIDMNGH
jgi:hypothetical protein